MSEAARAALAAHFAPAPPARLGVAVSGGSDSLALLHLLHDWRDAGGPSLRVATVDHGLRPEAATEASEVARICAGLGLPHETLHWHDEVPHGNLPDRARRARYRLLEKGLAELKIMLSDPHPKQRHHMDVSPKQDAAMRELLVMARWEWPEEGRAARNASSAVFFLSPSLSPSPS